MAMLQDIEVDDYYKECVDFEPLQVKEEFMRLPPDHAYWGERYADALKGLLRARAALEQIRARVSLELRAELQVKGEKFTEGVIEAKVTTHPDVIAAVSALIDAETDKARMLQRVNVIGSKKEALVSYGAQIRKEMDGDPSMREQSRMRDP